MMAKTKKRKRKDGDDDKAETKKIPWGNKHPAKHFLKDAFKFKVIPLDYSTMIGPRQVWEEHCQNNLLLLA
jgi:hypothetical protein